MLLLCSVSIIASATDYYVSSSGNDSANGLTGSTPWRTIAKVNSEFSRFNAGDRILFKRGDLFHGTLSVTKSGAAGNPIVIDAYDSGNEPIISGFTSVDAWTNEGGGIYSKSISSQSAPNIVTLDGKNVTRGRWPNSGWMIIDSHSGTTSLTDAELPSAPDWDGAEVIVRTAECLVDRSIITSHSGHTLTYSAITEDPVDGSGYFIQNHPRALDSYGEWCYTNSTLYIYFGSENPTNHTVKVSVLDNLVDISFEHYITFRNIHFEGANVSGVHFFNSDYITVQNCIIENGGRYGIFGNAGSDNAKIDNNRVINNNNIGIYFEWNTCINTNITNNLVAYSGYLLGMGLSGYDSYCGIINSGDNSITSYNKVEYNGYCGIKFGGENAEVSYNFINYSCLNKDDGAGIYTFRDYSPNKVIKFNIVLNSLARPDGWHYYEDVRSHGIYLDGAYNVLVNNNTLASNDGCGIFMNAGRGVTSEFNTCYDNVWGIRVLSEPDIGLARNHNINNNILFAKEYIVPPSSQWKQSAFGFVTKLDESDIGMFGISDNNYFARPVNDDNYIDVWYNAWGGQRSAYNLSEWTSRYGKDSNSQSTPITVSDTGKIRFLYNNLNSNKVISLDASYIDVKGAKYSGTITLQPYSSAILMVDPNPSAPPSSPVYTGSSIKNDLPSVIEVNYNLTLSNITPAISSFSVQVNSAGRTMTSVTVSGAKVLLTLSDPVVYGDIISLSYTVPSSNPLQTPAGGTAESFSAQSVTNMVNAVSPPPVVVPPPVTEPPPVVVNPPPVIPNVPPVVKVNYLTENFSGFIGTLNASSSYDSNNDNLIYSWKTPDHMSVSSTNGPIIEYLAPIVDINQTFEFELTVSDGKIAKSESFQLKILPYKPGLEKAEVISVESGGDSQSPNNPYNIIDGNIGTMWVANGIDQWIILELNGFFSIQHAKLAFDNGQKTESYFDVLGSDDKQTWEPIISKSKSCAFSGDLQVFEFPASKTVKEFRYIKLIGQGNAVDQWNTISEFGIFGYRHKNSPDYEDQAVKIYPNPAYEIVNILIDEVTFNPDFIKIITLSGETVYDDKIDPAIRQFQIPVNYKKGIYIVQMGSGDMTMFAQKLIVSR